MKDPSTDQAEHPVITAAKRLIACQYDRENGEFLIGPNGEKYSRSLDGLAVGRTILAISRQPDYEEQFHQIMDALRRSKWEHGDCKSGERYGGIPKACSACMANIKIEEMLTAYKGRTVRLA